MFDDIVQENIKGVSPYQPGLTLQQIARTYGVAEKDIIKIASNENPQGPSPKALKAAQAALLESNRYPDQFELNDALANKYNVEKEQIILGNGSNDILDLLARVFLGRGNEAISSQYGFQIYRLLTQLVNARSVIVPAKNYGHDLEAIAQAINENTRIVWIANPNNPTGTFNDEEKLLRLLAKVPEHVIVVLDEAYYEYLGTEDAYDAISWLERFPRLVVVRTFSKAYGLAGFRVGYGIGHPELIAQLQKARQPFNVSVTALATATAALKDEEYLKESVAANREGVNFMTKDLELLKMTYIPTFTNFVTIVHEDAERLHKELLKRGVITRWLGYDDLPRCLRCSIGTPEENRRFIKALKQLL